jgi:hypothetical protein
MKLNDLKQIIKGSLNKNTKTSQLIHLILIDQQQLYFFLSLLMIGSILSSSDIFTPTVVYEISPRSIFFRIL